METTDGRYDFYKRAFKGGADATQAQQEVQAPVEQPQQEQQQADQTQQQADESQQDGMEQLNQQVPKTKINFKISNMIGNLDQTLGSKQKINIDSMFVKQLFGMN